MTIDIPIALALGSAAIYGASNVFAKLSLGHLHPVAVAALFTLTNLIVAAPIGFSTVPLEAYRWEGVLSFTVMGLIGYAGLRLVFALGIQLLGVSRHAPIAGIYPLFTTFGAVYWLGESPGPWIWLGTAVIASGVLSLGAAESDGTWSRRHLALPAVQALLRAVGALFRKVGLLYMNTPMLAIAIGGVSGLACLFGYLWIYRKDETIWKFSAKGLFLGLLLGLSNTLAQYLYTVALSASTLSLIIPVTSTAPLFAVFFAWLFSRESESFGWRTIMGGAGVVAGTMLITLR